MPEVPPLPRPVGVDAVADAFADDGARVGGHEGAGVVQAVGARVRHQFDRPWGDQPRQGRLVVIAEKGDIDPVAIRAALT